MDYQPEKRGKGTSVDVIRNLWILIPALLVCGLIACLCLANYQGTLPTRYLANDPHGQVRSVYDFIIKLFLTIGSGTILIFIYDWKFDGQLFRGILYSPIGCAIFASVLFLGPCLLGMWG